MAKGSVEGGPPKTAWVNERKGGNWNETNEWMPGTGQNSLPETGSQEPPREEPKQQKRKGDENGEKAIAWLREKILKKAWPGT